MVALTVRLVVSLAVVVGLLLLTARLGSRRFKSSSSAPVRVVHRQSLSRTSAIAVIEVGSRTLLVGTTEHQVNLLTDLTGDLPREVADPVPASLDLVPDQAASVPAAGDSFAPHLAAALATRSASVPRPRPVLVTEEPADAVLPLEVVTPVPSPSSRRPGGAHRRTGPAATSTRATGPLAGSVLSADTWRQALSVARGRAR